jgi:hypothetical protein
MSLNTDAKTGPTPFLDDIERRVSEIFSAQKSEVEQSLMAKISREKEDAQKRIDAVNQEFAQVRNLLDQHKSTMAELETTEHHLRGEIRGHFDRAVNYQMMMEHAAALAGDELEKIGGLHQELERIRVKAEAEYGALKTHLGGYAGLMAQLPAPAIKAESEVDWMSEIGKLRQVRDLMATLRHTGLGGDNGDAPTAEAAASEPQSAPAAETAEELAASLGLIGPDDDGVHDDAEFALSDRAWAAAHDGGNGQPAVPPSFLEDHNDQAGRRPRSSGPDPRPSSKPRPRSRSRRRRRPRQSRPKPPPAPPPRTRPRSRGWPATARPSP